MTESDSENLEILLRVPTEIEAAPLVSALAAQGVKSTVTGGFTAGFIAEAPGDVQIHVMEKDLKLAQKILEQFQSDNRKIDWSKIDVGSSRQGDA